MTTIRETTAESMQPEFKIPESVLVVIHTVDLQVLLLERADKTGFWQSVTGSKDNLGELLHQTAIREVREETGISVQHDTPSLPARAQKNGGLAAVPFSNLLDWQLSNVYEIYPVWRHRYAPGVVRNTEHVFSLQVPRDIPVQLSPREHVRYRWLSWREAADCCFSSSNAEAILQLPARVSTTATAGRRP